MTLNARLQRSDRLVQETQSLQSIQQQRWLLIGVASYSRIVGRFRHQGATSTQRVVVSALSVNLNRRVAVQFSRRRTAKRPDAAETVCARAYGITVHPRPPTPCVRTT
jgi:hypothetical protein